LDDDLSSLDYYLYDSYDLLLSTSSIV